MNDLQNIITDTAEQHGWTVAMEKRNGSQITFCFSKYTPYGQDFSFSADTFDNDADVLLENIFDYYQSYDPDYEAYLWIGNDGHGRNGAPYHIIDIVNDMKAAENMVYELHTALSVAFNG